MIPSPSELKPEKRAARHGISVTQSLVICALLLTLGVIVGILSERFLFDRGTDNRFARLGTIYKVIDEDFYYRATHSDDAARQDSEMQTGAIDGALQSLGDPYTRYLDVPESQTTQEDLKGTYGGIGIDIMLHNGNVMVTGVVPDSPADRGGIRPGDVIAAVNGQPLNGEDINDAVRQFRGDIGSVMSIDLIQATTGYTKTLSLTLEQIVVPSVMLQFLPDTNYAVIRISIFGESTVQELDDAITKIRDRGSPGVILDLRGNGGGLVGAARQILGRFLDPEIGPAMFEKTLHSSAPTPLQIEREANTATFALPMIVLVDGGTASAAEIVAGALRDYDRAILLGQSTFGKGSVQRVYEFDDGATLRVTVAEWFTPSMQRIQDEGLRPDVVIEPTASETDTILLAAIDTLNQLSDAGIATPYATPVGN